MPSAVRLVLAAFLAAALIAGGYLLLAERSSPPAEPVAATGEAPPAEWAEVPAAPVTVELFTSQGCASCPPADRLIGELAARPDLVVITRPVTYWDRLGWRDTLARPENTELQRGYSRRIADDLNVYTPQAVVDGRAGMIGSRRGEIEAAIADARMSPSGVTLAVARDGGGYAISLDGRPETPAIVSLVALDSEETVAIGRGELRGRNVTYTNVVRFEQRLGEWRGGPHSLALGRASLEAAGADRYAVIVREGEAGAILAARYL